MADDIPLVDVCIATLRRPAGLRRLLQSLRALETNGEFKHRITVADNDREATARSVVEEFPGVRYVVVPVQNIALARNAAWAMATGTFIASIDDDEEADPRWLLELVRCQQRFGADGVGGRVEPIFAEPVDAELRALEYFGRVNYGTETGTPLIVFTTANCLFRTAVLSEASIRLDPAFGLTGGSDTAFSWQLQDLGYRFVYCNEAVVREHFSEDRARLRWLLRRRFRIGLTLPRIEWAIGRRSPQWWLQKAVREEIPQLLKAMPRTLWEARRSRTPLYRSLCELAYWYGVLSYIGGATFEEYAAQNLVRDADDASNRRARDGEPP